LEAHGAAELEAEGGAAQHYPLAAGAVQLGRDPGSDIVLADPAASWRHARVVRRGADFIIEDLGSLNGTWLNGRRLGGPEPLRQGDRLRIGMTEFRVVPPAPPAAADNRPPRALPRPPGAPRVQVEERRRARDVGSIVATPYFQALQRAAARRRARVPDARRAEEPPRADPPPPDP
jgi:hypothetical protein